MEIDGIITNESNGCMEIVGFTGADLECEGCEQSAGELFETGDSVMLCRGCYDDLAKSNQQLSE